MNRVLIFAVVACVLVIVIPSYFEKSYKKKSIEPIKITKIPDKFTYYRTNLWPVIHQFECGNHPTCCNTIKGDSGGYTCFGVSEQYHEVCHDFLKTYKGVFSYEDKDFLASLCIYNSYYLDGGIFRLPRYWRLAVLDFAIHAGNYQAIKKFQKFLGVKEDGVIGPNTLEAASLMPIKSVFYYIDEREKFLKSIKSWKIHKKAWINRLVVLKSIYEERVKNNEK